MQLKELLKNINYEKLLGEEGVEVQGLCHKDCEAKENYLFFCLSGSSFDGHDFAHKAVANGASAIVTERALAIDVTQIIVQSVREAMSLISKSYYNNSADRLKIIGVTGTNGKTTTCHLIASALAYSGKKVGIIGTLGVSYADVTIPPLLTTPDPIFLHKIFNDMYQSGIEYVVMEVSAHAIELCKIRGIRFEAGVYTNCTQDHLDYFKTMEKYRAVKSRFMSKEYCNYLIFNTDDQFGKTLFLKTDCKAISYGIDCPSDVFAVSIKETLSGVSFYLNLFDEIYSVRCKMTGLFNVYNCLAAITACWALGIRAENVINGIRYAEGVKGRIERVKNKKNKSVFIDYAHTPDGLQKVLKTLKKCAKGNVICLFGCGGNRDKEKRPIMGEIAGSYAHFTVLTSDNPRYEDPCVIINDIESGLKTKTQNYITIPDRALAIEYAINKMSTNDVLLIAGKGAEEYQEIMGVMHEFSDRNYVEQYLGKYEPY